MKSASPIGPDRGCSVSINAYLTLPRQANVVQPLAGSSNVHPTGIRFEYSWSNSFPDLSPTPSRRSVGAARTENDVNGRHDSSSGYCSGERPVVAATLTVSHPHEANRRVTQPYERRCRSTCSITLQTAPTAQPSAQEAGNYPLHPHHHVRRCSEGETWNSHTKVPQVVTPAAPTPKSKNETPATSVSSSSPIDKVQRRLDGRRKDRERPRTVHIDVYCTASESDEETNAGIPCGVSSDSDESNTSTCRTVVRGGEFTSARVRHVRKKNSLPHSFNQKNGGVGSKLKPVLSYRISAKELAEAVERKRSAKVPEEVLDDELFRDLTLTDSSVRSLLLADSEPESSDTTALFSQDSVTDYEESLQDRTWRSPEAERKRRMLEQRKQQWRAAKMADNKKSQESNETENFSTDTHPSRDGTLLNPEDLRLQLQRHLVGGSVSRRISHRCSTLLLEDPPLPPPIKESDGVADVSIPSFSPMLIDSSPEQSPGVSYSNSLAGSVTDRSSSSSIDHAVHLVSPPVEQLPWHWRIQQSPLQSPMSNNSPASWVLKKFGRHVGPARNPDCSCTHCLDHFARLRSVKESGGMIRV